MKYAVLLVLSLFLLLSCKKDKKDTAVTAPEPVKTGSVILQVLTYDSLGTLENNFSGVSVSLYPTALSAVTGSNGLVSFPNVPYGDIMPVLLKGFYEAPPLNLRLNAATDSVTIPCARFSAYKITYMTGFVVSPDSVALHIKLDRAIPAGKACKLAVLFSDTTITANTYLVADTLNLWQQETFDLNVARLPNFKKALAQLGTTKNFYIGAVPVSYGLYYSNVFSKNIVVGDNPYFPDNLIFNKTW